MLQLNKVFIAGNLTRDPELKHISSGDAVCTLGLAVNKDFTTRDGEKKNEVLFVDVTVWKKQAEACGQYLSKGSAVFVEGELRADSWEQDGQKRSKMRITAQRVQFLSGKKEAKEEQVDEETPF